MINQFPPWKNTLVVLAVLLGTLYALPNLFGEDPALQISRPNVASLDPAQVSEVESALRNTGSEYMSLEVRDGLLFATFEDTDAQLEALEAMREALGRSWVVALNRVSRTPGWMRALGGGPMNLGLDLVGGVHFLMEVDLDAAVSMAEERHESGIRTALRDEGIRYGVVSQQQSGGVRVTFRDEAERDRAVRVIEREYEELDVRRSEGTEIALVASLSGSEQEATRQFAVEQNITTLRNRVNELGVAEPVVQRQGENRVVVQLPGVQDTARAKEILGATAILEWRLVDEDNDPYEARESGRVPVGSRLYTHARDGRPVLLKRDVIVTGDQLTGASSGIDSETGSPAVFVNLDASGARRMGQATRENLNRGMAVVYIENVTEMVERDGEQVPVRRTVEEVISVATIRGVFSSRFQITGLEPLEARNLALLLRAGALAAPMDIVEERTIGPSMGADNIAQGFNSVVIGFLLVVGFVLVYYRLFGLVANMALFMNLVFIIAIMSMIPGATLTLPGIAGIVLTVGMAVDANVLIFERIREELRLGNTPQAAIHSGYEKAFSSIADANVTTLIASVVLFLFGTGPIKGFAVTLSIGIICSMFTAIVGTRAVINKIYGGRRVKELLI